ncbi:endonuclease [Chryseobacterium sp. LC2016-29]|uniref:endonuclease n=1 Tax=Chryseobacterium sp. LC2016-29 TaxID=2897331 RepID=UPI001E6430CF|nr:endonuclease [Chryseobacterium sp. LC2016-29]MCD0480444.1 endonuclease [Chryseobacterium sp. LC2016-29]
MKFKSIFLRGFIIFSSGISAQIPTGYYDGTSGLTGSTLKTKLHQIINVALDKGYSGLWTAYQTTDRDYYYENNGKVLDMYSERPTAQDPYEFTISTDQCGNYQAEGQCYNREHTVPQSLFSSANPMHNDVHFIPPTDGKVNGMRDNYPYGIVGTASWTSLNGSKLGTNSTLGYSGTVFEPINEFKGDIARMIFYFVTRYENKLATFSTGNILGGSTYPGLQQWELNVLLLWNDLDPVSQREIDRNNACYAWQQNRNPYIDNPNWVHDVWGSTLSTNEQVQKLTEKLQVFPNPVQSLLNISGVKDLKKVKNVKIFNLSGILIKNLDNPFTKESNINVDDLEVGTYILNIDKESVKFIKK